MGIVTVVVILAVEIVVAIVVVVTLVAVVTFVPVVESHHANCIVGLYLGQCSSQ